jgi:hypothetical protein
MDDRERREIEAIEAMIMEAEAKQEREREELRQAWDNLKRAVLEALGIPALVSWLAKKIERIMSKEDTP